MKVKEDVRREQNDTCNIKPEETTVLQPMTLTRKVHNNLRRKNAKDTNLHCG